MRNSFQIKINESINVLGALLLFSVPLRWLSAWLIAVTLHEFSHYMAVKVLGGNIFVVRIDIHGIQMEADGLSDRRRMIAILSGPLFGFFPSFFGKAYPELAICCWILTFYNLLPFADLDGGNFLRILINNKKIIKMIENIFLTILISGGIYCAVFLRLGILSLLPVITLCFRNRKKPCQERFCKVQ